MKCPHGYMAIAMPKSVDRDAASVAVAYLILGSLQFGSLQWVLIALEVIYWDHGCID